MMCDQSTEHLGLMFHELIKGQGSKPRGEPENNNEKYGESVVVL